MERCSVILGYAKASPNVIQQKEAASEHVAARLQMEIASSMLVLIAPKAVAESIEALKAQFTKYWHLDSAWEHRYFEALGACMQVMREDLGEPPL